jgi:hypothetical protein
MPQSHLPDRTWRNEVGGLGIRLGLVASTKLFQGHSDNIGVSYINTGPCPKL